VTDTSLIGRDGRMDGRTCLSVRRRDNPGWILYFVKSLKTQGGISPTNRHLLVLDGHELHVILELVYKAMQIGLDLLTLPSYTCHNLKPLDVSVFRPINCTFRGYRDAWTLQHRGQPAQKEDLVY
jgi:hypothetical protein